MRIKRNSRRVGKRERQGISEIHFYLEMGEGVSLFRNFPRLFLRLLVIGL